MESKIGYEELKGMSIINLEEGSVMSKLENVLANISKNNVVNDKIEGGVKMTNNTIENKGDLAIKVAGMNITVGVKNVDNAPKMMDPADMDGFDGSPFAKRALSTGKAWYEKHVEGASMPTNIPTGYQRVAAKFNGAFLEVDLSRVTSEASNEVIGLPGGYEISEDGVDKVVEALRFLQPRDDKSFATLQVRVPGMMFTTEGWTETTVIRNYMVYNRYDQNNNLRPSVLGMVKSDVKYVGQVNKKDKDGNVVMNGTKPVTVSAYVDGDNRMLDIPLTVEQYAQIMSFVKDRVEQRLAIINSRR